MVHNLYVRSTDSFRVALEHLNLTLGQAWALQPSQQKNRLELDQNGSSQDPTHHYEESVIGYLTSSCTQIPA